MSLKKLKNLTFVLLIIFFGVTFFGFPVAADIQPGSKEDPLVTKSYVDKYFQEKISAIEKSIDSISKQVEELSKRVEQLRIKINPIIKLTLNSKTAYIGEQKTTIDVAPFTIDGRTMVPFRFIGEALGAEIGWEASTQTVSYVLGDKKIEMKLGSKNVKLNGQSHTIDVPAHLKDGRTFVPVRAVIELLGAEVKWDPNTKSVTIIP